MTAVFGDIESAPLYLTAAAEEEDFFTPASSNYTLTFGGTVIENPTLLGDKEGRNENLAFFGVLLYGTPATGIVTDVVESLVDESDAVVNVYNMSGVLLRKGVSRAEALEGLGKGIYMINGKKVIR